MLLPQIALLLAALLCSLVAGFLFAFAVVVMPGIRRLESAEFLRAFQEMDGIIQRGHPLFGLVWIGSVLAVIAAAALTIGHFEGFDRLLLVAATSIYLLGVQLPTMAVNIPLNNAIQELPVEQMDEEARLSARVRFEARWNRWNVIRTAFASVASGILVLLLLLI